MFLLPAAGPALVAGRLEEATVRDSPDGVAPTTTVGPPRRVCDLSHNSITSRGIATLFLDASEQALAGHRAVMPPGTAFSRAFEAYAGGPALSVTHADRNEIRGAARRRIVRDLPRYLG